MLIIYRWTDSFKVLHWKENNVSIQRSVYKITYSFLIDLKHVLRIYVELFCLLINTWVVFIERFDQNI